MTSPLQLTPIDPLSLEENSDVAQNWAEWKESFEDDIKKTMLLQQSGLEVQHIFRTTDVAENMFDDAVAALGDHFMAKKNVVYERHVFRQASQGSSESVDAYLTRLRNLIQTCDYPADEVNSTLRDQIIDKCFSNELRDIFLSARNLTLENVVEIARAHEMAESQARQIQEDTVRPRQDKNLRVNQLGFQPQGIGTLEGKGEEGNTVNSNYSSRLRSNVKSSVAGDKMYRKRGKVGNLTQVCRSTIVSRPTRNVDQRTSVSQSGMKRSIERSSNVRNFNRGRRCQQGHNPHVDVVKDIQSDLEEGRYCVFHVMNLSKISILLNFKVSNASFEFLIDSGASCNIITAVDFEKLGKSVILRESNELLHSYGVKTPLKVRGEFTAKIEFPSRACINADFVVVEKNDVIVRNLLGTNTAKLVKKLTM